jgi:hypothetical protein
VCFKCVGNDRIWRIFANLIAADTRHERTSAGALTQLPILKRCAQKHVIAITQRAWRCKVPVVMTRALKQLRLAGLRLAQAGLAFLMSEAN